MTEINRCVSPKHFLNDFWSFEDNTVHLLMAIARKKENENSIISGNDVPAFREIVTDRESRDRALRKLTTLAKHHHSPSGEVFTYRLYASVNPRSVEGAVRSFQKEIVDALYHYNNGHDGSMNRLSRLDSVWRSELQKRDQSAGSRRFLVDLDDDRIDQAIDRLSNETTIHTTVETPNGYHIITDPFNYTTFEMDPEYEIKPDDMIFLKQY